MTYAIQCDGVSAGYRKNEILKDLSFSIARGSFCGIIGPNGSGKTTLLRTITGLVRACSGRVCLFGTDLCEITAEKRSRLIGLVPQIMETAMPFTVAEIVMIGRTVSIPRWGRPAKKDRLIAERSMVYTNVIDLRNKLFSELSGGERQRVVVAMVLAQEPEIMLLDEATSHLDINHRLEVMQIVERLHSEHDKTIMMVSHDLNMAAEFCDRLIMLNAGRLKSDGTPENVLNEKTLREVYHCDIRVARDPAKGTLRVLPSPRLAPEHSGRGIRVHVIGGGGCGEEILRRLSICEYTVTCGVLNEQDSDADVTAALDIPTVLEKPFSPITEGAIRRAWKLVEAAQIVIVSSVPFGSGNLANLGLARQAIESGKEVMIMEGIEERDYTAGLQAVDIVNELYSKGAGKWTDITDLVRLLGETRLTNPKKVVSEV
ncbi:MAG: ABC transporter ATP-binding protein [Verrucomicrobiota bacterium]